jgi:hypothetical protein
MQNADMIGAAWREMNLIVRRGTNGGVPGIEPFKRGEGEPSVGLSQFGGVLDAPRISFFLPRRFLGTEIGSENGHGHECQGSAKRTKVPGNHWQSIRWQGRGKHSEPSDRGGSVEGTTSRVSTTLETEEGGVEVGEIGGEAIVASVPFIAALSDADSHDGEILQVVGGVGKRWKMLAEKSCRFRAHQATTVFHRQHGA